MRSVLKPVLAWTFVLSSWTAVSAAPGDLDLVQAVKDKEPDRVRTLLKQKADVNKAEADGATALHWAVRAGDSELTDLLLKAGAKVNAANAYGVTPLSLACINRSAPMIEKLLAAGADANATTAMGETALMTCTKVGSTEGVAALLARGATNVNARESSRGQTVLMWAATLGYPEIVRLLLKHGAEVKTVAGSRALFISRGMGRDEEDEFDVTLGGFSPLMFAARQNNPEVARLLVEAGADVNEVAPTDESVLVVAAFGGNGKVAQYLIEKGANVHDTKAGYSPLHLAVLRGDLDLIKLLLAKGVDPNVRVTKGSRVWRVNDRWQIDGGMIGATPFFLATQFCELEMMRTLKAAGADPNIPIANGTPAIAAAAGLLWNDIRVDRRERAIPSELGAAIRVQAEKLNYEATKLAIEMGADVNAATRGGDTALHGAARKAWPSIVKLLIDNGAKQDVKNKRGQTPKDMMCFDKDGKMIICGRGDEQI